jgi:hypothetical protein
MSAWTPIGVVTEGQSISVQGVNPWKHEWVEIEHPPLELPHPSYPNQRHAMNVYEVSDGKRTVRFAAGELSANVRGFYVAA